MINYYEKITEYLSLNDKATVFLLEKGRKIIKNHEKELENLISLYYEKGCEYPEIAEDVERFADSLNEHIYTVNYVFFVCATKTLEKLYEEKGIDKQIFYDTIMDISYKENECEEQKGVYGVFAANWYRDIFKAKTFKLGRLQYQECECYILEKGPYKYGDVTVKNGDKVYHIHIPSCGPLTKELREESYKKAYDFLDKTHNGKVVLLCRTWLLYEKNPEFLGADSNVVDFMKDFDLLPEYVEISDANMNRIFGYEYDGKPENLPRKTRMQRAVADWYEKGNHLGTGAGVIIMDENGRWNKQKEG